MARLNKFKPAFWDHKSKSEGPGTTLNFQRKWKLIVVFTTFIALLPLFVMTVVDYKITCKTIKEQTISHMNCSVSATAQLIEVLGSQPAKNLTRVIDQLNPKGTDDLFIVDKQGKLLTPSLHFGAVGSQNAVNTSFIRNTAGVTQQLIGHTIPVIISYRQIPGSDLTAVLIKEEKWFTDAYLQPRLKLAGYLIVSIVLIILSILWTATFLVGRIHSADKKRVEALQQVESANKLAAIGRLASGVAHEINNPLAIINEKSGLIFDLVSTGKPLLDHQKISGLSKDVTIAVERCSTITRRLLDFARHMEPSIQPLDIEKVISQVMAFFENEAKRRNIIISVNCTEPVEGFESDRGSLQQIFLNLIENAFDAMENGGKLEIIITKDNNETLRIMLSDSGTGIARHELDKIFEPFYSSKDTHWGGGLGLSIIYGLTKQLGGDIKVESKEGYGTRFFLTFPLKATHCG